MTLQTCAPENFASVNGGPSRGSCVGIPRSEDPNGAGGNFPFCHCNDKLQMMMKSNSVRLIESDIAVKERTNANSCIMEKSVSVI